MQAVTFDGHSAEIAERAVPARPSGWSLIRVHLAGVCRTDVEITRGYMSHRGVLGHEFVGVVEESDEAALIGCRVVGDINAACGSCTDCQSGLGHHCRGRRVLGIDRLDGCMAEYTMLPDANLSPVPDSVGDDRAVFAEPLAAAIRILEQVTVRGGERCAVVGDGKLGILCAWVLSTSGAQVTLIGHHPAKMAIARRLPVMTTLEHELGVDPDRFDLVVEASGSRAGLARACALCRPRGTVVLKSTIADPPPLDVIAVVVDEITLVGSRCGPMPRAAQMLATSELPVEALTTDRFPIADAQRALARAAEPGVLKVVIDVAASSRERSPAG